MAGLDTNILVRWLVDDDAAQSAVAAGCFHTAARQQQRLFVPVTVTLELEWVLRSRYRYGKTDVQRAFNALLETRELLFQSEAAIERALHAWRNGSADFADCLHASLCSTAGHAPLLSFDARAARLAGIELLR
ncbi:PIN domain-containing protein [Nevskia sp.]|uniref:PIN domain-containing protein n=1 Tax=Nevskia sp. TaxID=1929292 RepID=UPI0025D6E5B6|nr:type II toxin-antitoxin system VapC family toxin [Nevskia sp.]